jgi:hypothetical protein
MQLSMKTSIFAVLTLILCLPEATAQDSEHHTQPRRLTYEQVLERWDRSRAYGDPRSLRQFSDDMVTRLKTGDESDDFSEGLRDGPWIRFYARSEQIFEGATGLVMIGVLIAILFAILFLPGRFLLLPFRRRRVLAISGKESGGDPIPKASQANDDSGLYGVGGWLLVLCIWLTIIGPLLSFAKLSETSATNLQWLWGIVWILFSLVTGILLWTKRRIGWQVANVFYWSISGFAWALVFLDGSSQHISQAIAMSVVSGIWLPYLNKSKRVLNTYRSTPVTRPTQPLSIQSSTTSPISLEAQLRALAKLREDGIINDDEFNRKKQKILDI